MKLIVCGQQLLYIYIPRSNCITGIASSIHADTYGNCHEPEKFTGWEYINNGGIIQFIGCGNYRLDEYS